MQKTLYAKTWKEFHLQKYISLLGKNNIVVDIYQRTKIIDSSCSYSFKVVSSKFWDRRDGKRKDSLYQNGISKRKVHELSNQLFVVVSYLRCHSLRIFSNEVDTLR